jgi:predicted XRE-type DNA-binding protein
MIRKKIPDAYFDNQEFLLEDDDDGDDENAIGILGRNASPEQVIKFELCLSIGAMIKLRDLTYPEVEKITALNQSDVSRIVNRHLDRFTIDRLIKIYHLLDTKKSLGLFLKNVSKKIDKLSA